MLKPKTYWESRLQNGTNFQVREKRPKTTCCFIRPWCARPNLRIYKSVRSLRKDYKGNQENEPFKYKKNLFKVHVAFFWHAN